MLPTETFADVVSFLGYYDLGGLMLASKPLSAIADGCADAIRLFDFSDLKFYVFDNWINIYRVDSDFGSGYWVCELRLNSENDMAEFLSDAFRNCTVGHLKLVGRHEHVLNAIGAVAPTIVAPTLEVTIECSENVHDLVEYVGAFRRVENLTVWPSYPMTVGDKETLKNFCQSNNIALRP